MPPHTAKGGEFLSPTGNISCEIDYQNGGLDQVYCQTIAPPRSVTMSATGVINKKCSGEGCIGNPAEDARVLPYGASTSAGPPA